MIVDRLINQGRLTVVVLYDLLMTSHKIKENTVLYKGRHFKVQAAHDII